MTPRDCYGAYRETKVNTASKRELVLMLYDGLLQFLSMAEESMKKDDLDQANHYITRSRRIIAEFLSSIRPETGEVARNMQSLHFFCFKKLVEANLKKEPDELGAVMEVITKLRDGWQEMQESDSSEVCHSGISGTVLEV